jgi:hypothetical protein
LRSQVDQIVLVLPESIIARRNELNMQRILQRGRIQL